MSLTTNLLITNAITSPGSSTLVISGAVNFNSAVSFTTVTAIPNLILDWGNIDGNIADQTDLQTALSFYAQKVSSATVGAIAILDANGNYTDSEIAFTTDGTLSLNLDTLVPTEKAVKSYVDNSIATIDGGTF